MRVLLVFLVLTSLAGFIQTEESEGPFPHPENEKPKKPLPTLENRKRLWSHLFKDYKKDLIPEDTILQFGLSPIDVSFNEEIGSMNLLTMTRMTWNDSRLMWNETKHNVGVLHVPSEKIWVPDIAAYNSLVPKSDCWTETRALVYPNGEVTWIPRCLYQTRCEILPENGPNTEQICTIKVGSWSMDGWTVDLQFYSDEARADLWDFSPTRYNITTNSAVRNERYFTCCEEPYIDLVYTLGFTKVIQTNEGNTPAHQE